MILKNKSFSTIFEIALMSLFILLVWEISSNVGYAVNLTESLPQKYFVVILNKKPHIGDYILFKAPLGSALSQDTHLIKKILAGKGDSVTLNGYDFYINNQWVATAKTHSLKREPLVAGPVGVLRENQYYVGTQHQDSFDSRYARIGWITPDLILGVAYPLW